MRLNGLHITSTWVLFPTLEAGSAVSAAEPRLALLMRLTVRQFRILRLRCEGKTQRQIAGALSATPLAVNNDLIEVYLKLGLAELADEHRLRARAAFCSLLGQLSEDQLLSQGERTSVAEEARRRATAALVEDEMALVQAQEAGEPTTDIPPAFPAPRRATGAGRRPAAPLARIVGAAAVVVVVVSAVIGTVLLLRSREDSTPETAERTPMGMADGETSAMPPESTMSASMPTLLYQADWSKGVGEWSGSRDWSTSGGMLTNDGSLGSIPSIGIAPYEPPTTDYAVEAEIQRVSGYAFGLILRVNRGQPIALGNGYNGGVAGGDAGLFAGIPGPAPSVVQRPFEPGSDWHMYRLEVDGSTLRLLIDETLWASRNDTSVPSGWVNGLWAINAKINVRSYKVLGP